MSDDLDTDSEYGEEWDFEYGRKAIGHLKYENGKYLVMWEGLGANYATWRPSADYFSKLREDNDISLC